MEKGSHFIHNLEAVKKNLKTANTFVIDYFIKN